MNLEGRNLVKNPDLLPADRWIYSRLNGAAGAMTEAFLSYRYNDAAQRAYEYFWNDFCDWYVEATKLSLRSGDEAEKDRAVTVLLEVLAESLRLLHPLLPLVTEEIYQNLNRAGGPDLGGLLITAPYPRYEAERADPQAEERFAFLQELVRMVRTLRSECTIAPHQRIRVSVRLGGARGNILRENAELVKLLAGIGDLDLEEIPEDKPEAGFTRPEGAIGLAGSGFEAFVYIAGAVDMAFLKNKFIREIEKDAGFIAALRSKLGNGNFLKNAPPELVAGERAKLEDALNRTGKLKSYIHDMAE
jgi:valyl-tRNA synthetase